MKNNIAIIPARAGSRGLKDKNIKDLLGKPLMAYTIEAALKSGCFCEVVVSTDSAEYAEIAQKYGAKVPFLRSEENSSDVAGSWDVVREVLNQYSNQEGFEYVALLQPTSPLRTAQHIQEAFDCIERYQAKNIVSVVETNHPVAWCFPLSKDFSMQKFAESPDSYKRRQDLPKYYHENGAIYLVSAEAIQNREYNLYADHCHAYVMDKKSSIDIDDGLDFVMVKALLECKE